MTILVLFLSSTVFTPLYIALLVIPLLISRDILSNNKLFTMSKREFIGYIIILISVIFITFFNIIVGPISNESIDRSLGSFPYIVFIFLSLLIARFITIKDLRLLQWFIAFEICIGVVEYIFGISTFFHSSAEAYELADTGLLYQRRVYGVSSNSSVLAIKTVYLFTITILNIKLNNKLRKTDKYFLLFVAIGLFITFNRTSIIAVIISSILFFGLSLRNLMLLTVPTLVIMYVKMDLIIEQLTRGRGTVDYSGRDEIFSYFIDFWSKNILTGNNGSKLFWDAGEKVWHAHNSYLEFLASNGLIVSVLFLISWIIIFGKKTYIVLPVLILSIFQYAFLWGFNLYDIIIFSIIYNYQKKSINSERSIRYTFKPNSIKSIG